MPWAMATTIEEPSLFLSSISFAFYVNSTPIGVRNLRLHDVFNLMYSKNKEFKGKVSGEHGIGFAKRPYLIESLGEIGTQLMRKIKNAFEPKNILSPGKVI